MPFFVARVDWNPDPDTQLRLRVDSKPAQVAVNPLIVAHIFAFVQSPVSHGLRASLLRRLHTIQTRTTAELLAVLSENKRVDVVVNVAAPYVRWVGLRGCVCFAMSLRVTWCSLFHLRVHRYVILPYDASTTVQHGGGRNGLRLVADLGNLTFRSQSHTPTSPASSPQEQETEQRLDSSSSSEPPASESKGTVEVGTETGDAPTSMCAMTSSGRSRPSVVQARALLSGSKPVTPSTSAGGGVQGEDDTSAEDHERLKQEMMQQLYYDGWELDLSHTHVWVEQPSCAEDAVYVCCWCHWYVRTPVSHHSFAL